MDDPVFAILLIDDDAEDVALTRQMLRNDKARLDISSAPNGQEALAFLRRQGAHSGAARPDLILLDLNMPVMGGREFLRAMKADPGLKDIPVVILTSSKAAEEIVASYGLGASGYVNKPMDLSQFEQVTRIVEEFREAAEMRTHWRNPASSESSPDAQY